MLLLLLLLLLRTMRFAIAVHGEKKVLLAFAGLYRREQLETPAASMAQLDAEVDRTCRVCPNAHTCSSRLRVASASPLDSNVTVVTRMFSSGWTTVSVSSV